MLTISTISEYTYFLPLKRQWLSKIPFHRGRRNRAKPPHRPRSNPPRLNAVFGQTFLTEVIFGLHVVVHRRLSLFPVLPSPAKLKQSQSTMDHREIKTLRSCIFVKEVNFTPDEI